MRPRRTVRRLTSRLGRRGAALLILGGIWAVFGVGILTAPEPAGPGLVHLHELIPVQVRAALWMATGAAAMVFAWRRSPGHDGPGFVGLVLMPMQRTLSYGWSWVVSLVGEPGIGDPRGWVHAIIWAAVVALIMVISGWAETPNGFAPRRRERREGP